MNVGGGRHIHTAVLFSLVTQDTVSAFRVLASCPQPGGPVLVPPRYLLLRTHQLSLDAFLVALKFMQVEDVDIDEVQCILANLIYMVRGPSPAGGAASGASPVGA